MPGRLGKQVYGITEAQGRRFGEDPGYAQESISNLILAVSQPDLCFKDCAVAAQGTDWEK